MHDIACSVLCNNAHQDMLADLYNNLERLILDRHAPLVSEKIASRTRVPLKLNINVGEQ